MLILNSLEQLIEKELLQFAILILMKQNTILNLKISKESLKLTNFDL